MKCKERKDAGLASGQSQAGPGHRGADARYSSNLEPSWGGSGLSVGLGLLSGTRIVDLCFCV